MLSQIFCNTDGDNTIPLLDQEDFVGGFYNSDISTCGNLNEVCFAQPFIDKLLTLDDNHQLTQAKIYTGPRVIKGHYVIVDLFRVRSRKYSAYFLSHFHGDHYEGLDSEWDFGAIYSTKTTTMLLEMKLGVKSTFLRPLEYNARVEVKESPGLFVTALNANHCAGSAMFYFEDMIQGESHLFTGDFRYDTNSTICNRWVERLLKQVDVAHLDTSFSLNAGRGHLKSLNPIKEIFGQLRGFIKDGLSPGALSVFPKVVSPSKAKTLRDLNVDAKQALFVVTSCFPGRERLVGIIAQLLGLTKVAVIFGWRVRALQEGLAEYGHQNIKVVEYNPFTNIVPSSQLLVLPAKGLDVSTQMYDALKTNENNTYSTVVHIRSTGWDHDEPLKIISASPPGDPKTVLVSVSYTEHSDLGETQEFVRDIKPRRLRCVSAESPSEERLIISTYLIQYVDRSNSPPMRHIPTKRKEDGCQSGIRKIEPMEYIPEESQDIKEEHKYEIGGNNLSAIEW